MNTQSIRLLLASGLAVGLLSSCVAPYDHRGSASVSASYYEPGYRVTSLPKGYRSERIGDGEYYYYNGAYFQRHTTGYVVVDAPRTSRYYTEYDRYRVRRTPGYSGPYRNPAYSRGRTIDGYPYAYRGYRTINYGGGGYHRSEDMEYRRQGPGHDAAGYAY